MDVNRLLSTSRTPVKDISSSKFAIDPGWKLIAPSDQFLVQLAFAHLRRTSKEGGKEELWEWGKRRAVPHRVAQDMFTVTVHDRRVDDPATRLMVIIGERGRSERRGVVKRWFRPSLVDPRGRRQSRNAESPIYAGMRSRMSFCWAELFTDLAPHIYSRSKDRIPQILSEPYSICHLIKILRYLSTFNLKII